MCMCIMIIYISSRTYSIRTYTDALSHASHTAFTHTHSHNSNFLFRQYEVQDEVE